MFRWTLLSAACGFLAGLASALFLLTLDGATNTRKDHSEIIWLLPLGGLLIGLIYHYYGKDVAGGNNLILDEIHNPQKVVPLRMVPLIFGGTVLTHLFGGSAGREGTAVQMGASLSDQLSRVFKIQPQERKILLAAGAGAGFGAAIGTPWAGMVFGMEVIVVGRLKLFAWYECLIASFVGYGVTRWLSAPHSEYPLVSVPGYDAVTLLWVAVAGILFGSAAQIFTLSTHFIERVWARFISWAPIKPFVGGIIIVGLFHLEGSGRYVGLGIESIQEALIFRANLMDPLYKSFFTSLTVGTGFKGGEFIPLVFIGTTLGSALALVIPVSFSLLGAVGFAAVFGGAANTPIACTIMAMEIFGPAIGPYAMVGCYVSYLFSGEQGIYKTQRMQNKKWRLYASLARRRNRK